MSKEMVQIWLIQSSKYSVLFVLIICFAFLLSQAGFSWIIANTASAVLELHGGCKHLRSEEGRFPAPTAILDAILCLVLGEALWVWVLHLALCLGRWDQAWEMQEKGKMVTSIRKSRRGVLAGMYIRDYLAEKETNKLLFWRKRHRRLLYSFRKIFFFKYNKSYLS